MRKMVCPKCGRVEADPAARFCDIDGTQLVARAEPDPPSPIQSSRAGAERDGVPKHSGSAGLKESSPIMRSAPPAQPAMALPPPTAQTSGSVPGWPLLAGGAGLVLLAAAGYLFLTPGTHRELGNVNTRVQIGSGKDPNTTDATSSGRFASTDELLNRCYGSSPPLPRLQGGKEAEAFEIMKDVMRTGTAVGADIVTPDVTVEDERRVGDAVSWEMEKQHPPYTDRDAKRRFDGVASRLVKLAPRESELSYRFTILSADDLNAFMAPGGRGFITSALLGRTRVDDQLAFIIGHELAHSECQHSTRAVQIALAGRKLGSEVLGSGGEEVGEGLSLLSSHVLKATYDQDQEFEADRLGLCLAYLAGYDRRGGAGAMATLADSKQEAAPDAPSTGSSRIAYDIIATHPPLPERSRYLKSLEGKLGRRN